MGELRSQSMAPFERHRRGFANGFQKAGFPRSCSLESRLEDFVTLPSGYQNRFTSKNNNRNTDEIVCHENNTNIVYINIILRSLKKEKS